MISEQQKLAGRLMNILKRIDSKVILAGGAPRNWSLGKECRDLDFYLHTRDIIALASILEESGFPIIRRPDNYGGGETNMRISRILVGDVGGMPFEVMCMEAPVPNNPEDLVSQFASSISKIWWKDGCSFLTPHFKLTCKYRVIQFPMFGASAHVNKLKRYFPGYDYEYRGWTLRQISDPDTAGITRVMDTIKEPPKYSFV